MYEALLQNGFSNDEAGRLIGSLMRTASSKGWIRKTETWTQSTRNRSNIQIVWKGCQSLERRANKIGGLVIADKVPHS